MKIDSRAIPVAASVLLGALVISCREEEAKSPSSPHTNPAVNLKLPDTLEGLRVTNEKDAKAFSITKDSSKRIIQLLERSKDGYTITLTTDDRFQLAQMTDTLMHTWEGKFPGRDSTKSACDSVILQIGAVVSDSTDRGVVGKLLESKIKLDGIASDLSKSSWGVDEIFSRAHSVQTELGEIIHKQPEGNGSIMLGSVERKKIVDTLATFSEHLLAIDRDHIELRNSLYPKVVEAMSILSSDGPIVPREVGEFSGNGVGLRRFLVLEGLYGELKDLTK